jgi:hypothetical protein
MQYTETDILLVHTDYSLFTKFKSKNPKIIILSEHYAMSHAKHVRKQISCDVILACWLLEPESIHPECYKHLPSYANDYDLILTHHRWVVNKYPNAIYCPWGSTWIADHDRDIHQKFWSHPTCVFSAKEFTPLHQFRQKIKEWLHVKDITTYGRPHNPIENKISILRTAPFHIVVENCAIEGYYTEKIVDCFLTGTVPIYYGCPDIGKQFDERGIIKFKTLAELEQICSKLSMELYYSLLDSVKYNFEQAQKYINQEQLVLDTINTFIAAKNTT